MSDRFLARQLLQLGFSANALRPVPGSRAVIPAFFSGWLTSELAPQLAGVTALDTASQLARHGVHNRRDALGVLAAVANLASFAALVAGSRRAANELEDALIETLGSDYREVIERDPLPDDAAAPFRSLAMPFRVRNVTVAAERRVAYTRRPAFRTGRVPP